jgi:lycopene cyclase domain-containing protein
VSYLMLDLLILGVTAVFCGIILIAQRRRLRGLVQRWMLPGIVTGVLLFVLTAAFDTVMIAIGLFGYPDEALVGWFVGLAPIEDFAYPLAALMLLPSLWLLVGSERHARVRPVPGHGVTE